MKEQMVKGYHQQFVKTQFFALIISGLLPPDACSKCRWKSFLYDVYTMLCIISHIPFFSLQILGVYAYWGNLPVVAGIIFQMMVCFDGLVIIVYFTYRRKHVVHIFEMLRTEFLPYIRKVGRYQKQDTIMRESTNFSNRMNNIYMVIFVIVMSAWCVIPFFVKQLSHDPEKELANNTTGQLHLEYFVLGTWIPDNAYTFPTYEILYAGQFFYVWTVVTSFTVGNLVFTSMFYGIAIQFQLISAAIQDIDYICVDFEANLMNQEGNNLNENIFNSNVAHSNICNVETLREPKQTHSSTDKFSLNQINNVDVRDSPCGDAIDSADWPALYAERPNYAETMYMIECIKYHQRLLK
jgi:hypothetical protein